MKKLRRTYETLLTGAFLLAATASISLAKERVMSLNLCTDQLVMAVADPEQITSISFLARDQSISPLWQDAEKLPINHGSAEEVFLQRPDIVVTGTFSQYNTNHLLRRVGLQVEEFAFDMTLDTIPDEVRRMGVLIGQSKKAESVATAFETELARIQNTHCEPSPTILVYEQNGISPGANTLADSVFRAAGFRNVAAEAGLVGAAPFPLELVIANRPDVIIAQSSNSGSPTLGSYVTRHPALQALHETVIESFLSQGALSCNGPKIIEAIEALAQLRQEISPCAGLN